MILIGFSFVKILAPAYFAREDTKTPVRIGIVALLVNLVVSIVSAWYLTSIEFAGPHVGLAGATSLAALLNAGLLYRGLRRDDVLRHSTGWSTLMLQVVLANSVMCGILVWLHQPLQWWLDAGIFDRILWLAVSVVAGAIGYFLVLFATGLRPSVLRLKQ